MPAQAKSSSVPYLNLLTAFLPTLVLILYLRWDGVSTRLMNKLEEPSTVRTDPSTTLSTTPVAAGTNNPFDRMHDLYTQSCPKHDYQIRLFSQDPLILYIDNFLAKREALYMTALAAGTYVPSSTWGFDNETDGSTDGNAPGMISDVRTSSTAYIYNDPVAACIKQRAADFQGGIPTDNIEELQVVKYEVGKEYRAHFDYGTEDPNPRVSTFFLYAACDHADDEEETNATGAGKDQQQTSSSEERLAARNKMCEGGATNFPEYMAPFSESWCDVIDCSSSASDADSETDRLPGVSFRPIPGNAVYWSNVHPNGTYHDGVLHAGAPVKSGRKIGINIWTRRGKWDDEAYLEELRVNSEGRKAVEQEQEQEQEQTHEGEEVQIEVEAEVEEEAV